MLLTKLTILDDRLRGELVGMNAFLADSRKRDRGTSRAIEILQNKRRILERQQRSTQRHLLSLTHPCTNFFPCMGFCCCLVRRHASPSLADSSDPRSVTPEVVSPALPEEKKTFLFQTKETNYDSSASCSDDDDDEINAVFVAGKELALSNPACCDKSTTTRNIAQTYRSLADLYDRLLIEEEQHEKHCKPNDAQN